MAEGGTIPGSAQRPTLDERTSRYIVASRSLHEGLRQVLTQIAGFALLVVTPGRMPPTLDGPVALARQALPPVRDALAALHVPPQARHYHFHLSEAADTLARCLDLLTACLRADADDAARDALVRVLRGATDHLRAATRSLPGFELVI